LSPSAICSDASLFAVLSAVRCFSEKTPPAVFLTAYFFSVLPYRPSRVGNFPFRLPSVSLRKISLSPAVRSLPKIFLFARRPSRAGNFSSRLFPALSVHGFFFLDGRHSRRHGIQTSSEK